MKKLIIAIVIILIVFLLVWFLRRKMKKEYPGKHLHIKDGLSASERELLASEALEQQKRDEVLREFMEEAKTEESSSDSGNEEKTGEVILPGLTDEQSKRNADCADRSISEEEIPKKEKAEQLMAEASVHETEIAEAEKQNLNEAEEASEAELNLEEAENEEQIPEKTETDEQMSETSEQMVPVLTEKESDKKTQEEDESEIAVEEETIAEKLVSEKRTEENSNPEEQLPEETAEEKQKPEENFENSDAEEVFPEDPLPGSREDSEPETERTIPGRNAENAGKAEAASGLKSTGKFSRIIALNIETPNNEHNSICNIGFTIADTQNRYSTNITVNPEVKIDDIPDGMTEEQIMNSPTISQLWPGMSRLFDNSLIIAHNASYDLNILKKVINSLDLPVPAFYQACTYRMSKKFHPEFESYKLGSICEHYGIELDVKSAVSHSDACFEIFCRLINEGNPVFDEAKKFTLE